MNLKIIDSSLDIRKFEDKIPNIDELLIFCTDNDCSDLYIKVGEQPFISRWGKLYKIPSFNLTTRIWNDWSKLAITSENNAKYMRQKMLDFSYSIFNEKKETYYRYRVSTGFSLEKNIATFRMIKQELPSFDTINFPKSAVKILEHVLKKKNGITMFVGVTGSGKSTTLTASINDFSKKEQPMSNSVIISLEDPIEYIVPSTQNTNIIQKELGKDFKNFYDGVKQSLREHPNFINVGETRDVETLETLVEASRTGHGVMSSFHAFDCSDTISRMYNMLVGQNENIMYDLINNMNFILCQRLLSSDYGFKLLTQYIVFTDEIRLYLNRQISKNEHIPLVIQSLFQDQKLLSSGLIKDWS